MKFKKFVISSMSGLTIITPIATLVACEEKVQIPKDWTSAGDQTWNDKLSTAALENLKGDFSTWPLRDTDIFEKVFNNEKYGMLNITRLQDGIKFVQDDLLDTNIKGEDGNPQKIGIAILAAAGLIPKPYGGNSVWSKKITKAQIVADPMIFEKTCDEAKTYIDANPTKHLGALVSIEKFDQEINGKYVGGEYTVRLYALKNNTADSQVEKLATMFKDKTKFDVDLDQIKKFGGAYTVGQAYDKTKFSTIKSQEQNIWGTTSTIMHKDGTSDDALSANVHNDRTNEKHLKSWTGFGPKTEIAQSEIDSVKDVAMQGYLMQDAKTGIWSLVASIYRSENKGVSMQVIGPDGSIIPLPQPSSQSLTEYKTIYIPMPEITNFASSKVYTDARMQELIVKKTSYQRVYDFVKVIDKGTLDTMANSAKPFVIDLFNQVQFMYQSQKLLQDSTAFSALKQFIKTNDKNFDIPTFIQILEWLENKEFYNVIYWGARRMQLLTMLPRFYQDVQKFVNANSQFKNLLIELRSVK